MKKAIKTTLMLAAATIAGTICATAQGQTPIRNLTDKIQKVAPRVNDGLGRIVSQPAIQRVLQEGQTLVAPRINERRLLPPGSDVLPTIPGQPTVQPYVQPGVPEVQPYIVPGTVVGPPRCTVPPRMGFQGQMIFGYGMKIVYTNWGSIAQRAGLEAGDIIVRINGRPIRTHEDYDQALIDAVNYRGGHVEMLVRDVRSPYTCSRAFVPVHVDLPVIGIAAVGPATFSK